jgi:dihydrofolate reductase
MTVTLIAAVSDDGFISRSKGVPWDLPADRRHFRDYTAGKHLLLGRATFEEMTGWFTNHSPLVLSHNKDFRPSIGRRIPSVQMAIMIAERDKADELVVCGGAQCYAAALPFADKLVLTRVHTTLGSGVAFPEIDRRQWAETCHDEHPADETHAFPMTFTTLRPPLIGG